MFLSKTHLSLILIMLSAVDASPASHSRGKATISLARKINVLGDMSFIDVDRARAQAMKKATQLGKRSGSVSVTNAVMLYTAQVGVGTPATNYTLLIDTGSSNTFVGANKSYTPTSSSRDTGNTVSVVYGSGYFSGEEWIDTVTLGPRLVIDQQSIGVANTSRGFAGLGVDGILGVGPVDLTVGTVNNTKTVPTVSDNLISQGTISTEVLGIYFVPFNDSERGINGELTFGGYDSNVTIGSVNYVPLTTTSPASQSWGINMESIAYGDDTILSSTAGIVDTGTTLILIASNAFQEYQSKTGAVVDSATRFLRITSAQYANLESMYFNIGNSSYELTANGQIWPRSLNTAIGGSSSSIYLVVNDIGTPSGSGLDYIIGYAFLERYYSVFDTTNERVGFAKTAYTYSTSN